MTQIIPAILTDNTADLISKIKLIGTYAPFIHIDVMDGKYVSSTSISIDEICSALSSVDFSNKVELHLMCKNPEQYIEKIARIKNIENIILHKDSTKEISLAIEIYKKRGIKVGLCVNLNDSFDVSSLNPDFYFVLAEEEPGYSGTPFNMDALDRIMEIRDKYKDKVIEVDGGINDITGRICLRHGANALISNSFIFKSKDPINTLIKLQNLTINDRE